MSGWKRVWITVLILTLAAVQGTWGGPVDSEKLRQVIDLPMQSLWSKMGLTLGFSFSPAQGFHMQMQVLDLTAEVAALRQRLARYPDDARAHQRLGDLYAEEGDAGSARQEYARAVALYRRQAQAGHAGGRLLAEFGAALGQTGADAEAESVLRRAVRTSPREWRAWAALADLQEGRARKMLTGQKPGPEQIAEAQRLLGDARQDYDRAVAAAPLEPRVYARRAMFLSDSLGWLESLIQAARSGTEPSFQIRIPAQAIADFTRAARLMHSDPYAAATLAWNRFFYLAGRHGGRAGLSTAALWQSLTEAEKRPNRQIMTRLEQMARVKDRRAAARALTALGFLQYETFEPQNVARAQMNLRRALALDSRRPDAAEMLMHIYALEHEYPELAALAEDRLRRQDSPRLHVIAAYAEFKRDRPDAAEAQLNAALKREPRDFAINLALAAVVLKQGSGSGRLAEAAEYLQAAAASLGTANSPGARPEYLALHGIYLVRAGDVAEARREFDEAQRLNPSDPEAKQALAAITAAAR
jgi:tetratricopeptide (TPR) repeat protein